MILLLLYLCRVRIGICINEIKLFCCDCCGGYKEEDDDDDEYKSEKKSKYVEDNYSEDEEGKVSWMGGERVMFTISSCVNVVNFLFNTYASVAMKVIIISFLLVFFIVLHLCLFNSIFFCMVNSSLQPPLLYSI